MPRRCSVQHQAVVQRFSGRITRSVVVRILETRFSRVILSFPLSCPVKNVIRCKKNTSFLSYIFNEHRSKASNDLYLNINKLNILLFPRILSSKNLRLRQLSSLLNRISVGKKLRTIYLEDFEGGGFEGKDLCRLRGTQRSLEKGEDTQLKLVAISLFFFCYQLSIPALAYVKLRQLFVIVSQDESRDKSEEGNKGEGGGGPRNKTFPSISPPTFLPSISPCLTFAFHATITKNNHFPIFLEIYFFQLLSRDSTKTQRFIYRSLPGREMSVVKIFKFRNCSDILPLEGRKEEAGFSIP